jgi:hypothetical protein
MSEGCPCGVGGRRDSRLLPDWETTTMKMVICILTAILASSIANAAGLDNFLPAVVYLKTDLVETIEQDGRHLEIWLRDPATGKAGPKLVSTIGTAFLVAREGRVFIVTAQHVAATLRPNSTATVRLPDKGGSIIQLSNLLVSDWRSHESADVAVAEVKPNTESISLLSSAFSYDFITSKPITPSRSIRLTTIGFPLSLGIGKTVSPITRESMAASGPLDLPRFDNKKISPFFLLQDPSVGGFSGSPVFDLRLPIMQPNAIALPTSGSGPTCYGLVHGTISDDTGVKFAAIVPAVFIRQVIDQFFSLPSQ